MFFNFDPSGKLSSGDGRTGRMGQYTLQQDGRLCWAIGTGFSGCFQYYRRGSELRVRRADNANNSDIGPVRISNPRQPAPGPAAGNAVAPPYGNWLLLNGDACDSFGQSVVIAPDKIVVDYAGDLSTYSGGIAASCKDDLCTFRQSKTGLSWTTRQIAPDRIAFRGPHGPAGSQRSLLKKAESCR